MDRCDYTAINNATTSDFDLNNMLAAAQLFAPGYTSSDLQKIMTASLPTAKSTLISNGSMVPIESGLLDLMQLLENAVGSSTINTRFGRGGLLLKQVDLNICWALVLAAELAILAALTPEEIIIGTIAGIEIGLAALLNALTALITLIISIDSMLCDWIP